MTHLVTTERLVVRNWESSDAAAALAVFGNEQVSRWLAPAADAVPDEAAMSALIEQWRAEHGRPGDDAGQFVGRWALARKEDDVVVGALVLRTMPPHGEDVEIAWQLAPEHWGHSYATEGARALAAWAFAQGAAEVFAVVRPGNERGEWSARRIGMEWVGETDKYYDLHLRVYRLRPSDLAPPDPVTTGSLPVIPVPPA
ncbi:Protein N-acetyltransferase, RimJ/RimL family [Quadrisphaera granulorum]|uniref:RimJ/RimL family protein N-acetyltransferase n=1 Tax=Quadrisphaera granulorum TaxID=317664 RepID=A0A316ADW6_9ACTN|nr:GNAT family N-acetyltransferase [Quadrisphaera granulorum]PWJ55802.1 RimJ/RimL family protein N-acetyltransferase [Quadrisphaera granulorum]SZE95299.1 Protein N-acetyltransferase, RimJ/RimL family [Quadrisphaera granulorum]